MNTATTSFKLGCTALNGVNKTGKLAPDENGYYTVILGALDFKNSIGAVYPSATAKHFFKEGSGLLRRIKGGYCRAEYGHPKPYGLNSQDWITRILTIEETRICAHILEVWLDNTSVKDKDGRAVLAIMGKIKPSGPYGNALLESLQNPLENVAFSIRCLTEDRFVNGRLEKHIREIVGWDFVVEPGLSVANKYQNPALESFQDCDVPVTSILLQNTRCSVSQVGLESSQVIVNDVCAVVASLEAATITPKRLPSSEW